MKKTMIKKINAEKFYTPKQIADMGIMTAKTSDTKRQMLLRMIREKRIVAVNLGGDKKPRYVVQGKELIQYKNTQVKGGDYQTK